MALNRGSYDGTGILWIVDPTCESFWGSLCEVAGMFQVYGVGSRLCRGLALGLDPKP